MKKIVILIIFIIILILPFIFYYNNRIVIDNSGFELNDVLTVSVYEKVKISDFINNINGKIIDNKLINTNTLGTKEVSFIYLNSKNKKRKGNFKINVVDDEKPLIWLSDYYSVVVNSNINLLDSIMCADNYDPNPECTIEGYYDLNSVGEYKLSYLAKDASKNLNQVDFTLYVKDKKENGVSNNKFTYFSDVLTKYKTSDNEVGIDISKWQKEVDFEKVKNAGATFVILRVGFQNGVNGEYIIDPYFERNINKALENGLKVGVYFYSYANDIKESKKQAKWVLNKIKKYDISLPVTFDWECYSFFNQMNLSLFNLNEIADEFLNTVKKEGYEVMLYGSKNYLNNIWKYNTHDVWLAHYTNKTDYDFSYKMWQLCDNGIIDGIDEEVDIDVLYY